MSELKECPFCRGEVQVSRYCRDNDHWTITCPRGNCFLYGYSACGYKTRELAVSAWNTRSRPDVTELVEACEEAERVLIALGIDRGNYNQMFEVHKKGQEVAKMCTEALARHKASKGESK